MTIPHYQWKGKELNLLMISVDFPVIIFSFPTAGGDKKSEVGAGSGQNFEFVSELKI